MLQNPVAGCGADTRQPELPEGQFPVLSAGAPRGAHAEPAATLAYLRARLRLLHLQPWSLPGEGRATFEVSGPTGCFLRFCGCQ